MRDREANDQTSALYFTSDEMERLMSFRAAISAGLYGDESVGISASDLARLWLSPVQADLAVEAGFTPIELGRLVALKAAVDAGIYSEGRTIGTQPKRRGES